MNVTVELPPEILEAAAQRAAEIVLAQLAEKHQTAQSPYKTIPEAAEYLRCKRQRIDDLLSQGRLTRHKDGTRTLILHAELESYVSGQEQ
jgi:excisionase family DNA binding protein